MKVQKIPVDWRPSLPVFACESFLKAVGDDYGWLGGLSDSGELRCVLPYTIIRKPGLRMARFRVETIAIAAGLSIEEEMLFLEGVTAFLRSAGVDLILPATTNSIFRTHPRGAVAAPYGSYVIDLTVEEDRLWKNLNESHRRKVRLATKGAVQIQSGPQYQRTAYELVRETFARSKLGFMRYDAFERYIASLGDNVRILVSEQNGAVQTCAVVPFSEHGAYYVYGGSVPTPAAGAANLMHWEAIRQFRALGVCRYDFVGVRVRPDAGSKQDGLRMFKERFGGQLVTGYMWKYSFRPLKFAAYSLAMRVLRGGDIVDQERSRETHGGAPVGGSV